MNSSSSSQQNQYPYHSSKSNNHQPYYQCLSNNLNSNYSNPYVPQQQWQINDAYNTVAAAVVVASLAQQLTQFSTWYLQPDGLGAPVITGPGQGTIAFPGHGPVPAGQSLDGSGPSLQEKGRNCGRNGPRLLPSEKTGFAEVARPEAKSAGVARCELCKVDFGKHNLEEHKSGRRHRNKLKNLEANANKTVSDFQNEQKPSGDLKQKTTMKPDNLLAVGETTKKNPPENIPLDTVPTESKLENEQKINDVQKTVSSKHADQDLLAKKSMVNQLENQRRGLKRGWRVVWKKKKVSKAKRQLIEPPKPKVVIPLMCNLCNVKCDTREILSDHLLGKNHMSNLQGCEGDQAMYRRIGLQALYPPQPVTQSPYHLQGVLQVLNGAQVSDQISGASIFPQTENAAPSATGVSIS